MQKQTLKSKWAKMSKGQRIGLCIVLVIVFSGFALGIWLFTHSATTGYQVSSTTPIVFTDDLAIDPVDTTTNNDSKSEWIKLVNGDGNVTLMYTIEITTDDDTGDSCDPTGDYSITTKKDGIEVANGTTFLSEGLTTMFLNVTSTIAQYGCPANHTSVITLTPQ